MAMTRKQISLIHVAKNKLCLSEDYYRAILWGYGGVESSKELDRYGFEAVMGFLGKLGFDSDWKQRTFGHRAGMATPQQIEFIRKLWQEYTEDKGTDFTLGKWLDRTFKVSALRFITRKDAPKAITALKAMKAKKPKK